MPETDRTEQKQTKINRANSGNNSMQSFSRGNGGSGDGNMLGVDWPMGLGLPSAKQEAALK